MLNKLAVLGNNCVGKASLIDIFINDENHDDLPLQERIEITINIINKLCRIEILDTQGEEDYPNMMDMWINFGDGFLLVFSLTDKSSFEILPNKIQYIIKGKHDSTNIPMLIFGNKIDLT